MIVFTITEALHCCWCVTGIWDWTQRREQPT